MAGPTNVSLKGIIDWSQQANGGDGHPLENDINADKIDGKHYSDLKSEWETFAQSAGGGGGGAASGDIAGSYPGPITVDGLQGRAVASTAPSTGQVLTWNGSSWAPETVGEVGSLTSAYTLSYQSSSGNRHTYSVSIPAGKRFAPISQAAKLNSAFPSANFKIVMGSGESLGIACYTKLSAALSDEDGANGIDLSYDSTDGSYYYSSTLKAVNFYSSNSRDYELFASAQSGMTIPIRLVKMS